MRLSSSAVQLQRLALRSKATGKKLRHHCQQFNFFAPLFSKIQSNQYTGIDMDLRLRQSPKSRLWNSESTNPGFGAYQCCPSWGQADEFVFGISVQMLVGVSRLFRITPMHHGVKNQFCHCFLWRERRWSRCASGTSSPNLLTKSKQIFGSENQNLRWWFFHYDSLNTGASRADLWIVMRRNIQIFYQPRAKTSNR